MIRYDQNDKQKWQKYRPEDLYKDQEIWYLKISEVTENLWFDRPPGLPGILWCSGGEGLISELDKELHL